jgi:hypothetical protein
MSRSCIYVCPTATGTVWPVDKRSYLGYPGARAGERPVLRLDVQSAGRGATASPSTVGTVDVELAPFLLPPTNTLRRRWVDVPVGPVGGGAGGGAGAGVAAGASTSLRLCIQFEPASGTSEVVTPPTAAAVVKDPVVVPPLTTGAWGEEVHGDLSTPAVRVLTPFAYTHLTSQCLHGVCVRDTQECVLTRLASLAPSPSSSLRSSVCFPLIASLPVAFAATPA